MSSAWTLKIDERYLAWLTLDVPGGKVNLLTDAVLRELQAHVARLAAEESVMAVVIASGKEGSFIAGANIDDLARISDPEDARAKSRQGQMIFDLLAQLPVPVVAVIGGTCLGGGLELALACDHRLVVDHPRTSLGLPEVNLGIVPGWGGTQRLPRLIGLGPALRLIAGGKPVTARQALRMGLADGAVNQSFLAEQVHEFVQKVLDRRGRRALIQRRRRAQGRLMRLLQSNPAGRAMICRAARREVMRKTHGNYPAPLHAIDLVRRSAGGRAGESGFELESETFATLACTPISRHLVWLFQASQRLKKGPGPSGSQDIRRVGVVGAGIMGGGIAWALSRAGIEVALKDIDWEALARGMGAAAGMYRELIKRRACTEGQMSLGMHRIRPTVDWAGFERMDVIIEAVTEDRQLKLRVLGEMEQAAGRETVLCTNTSSLPLAGLAEGLQRARQFLGLHFFNPVNRMPLVEVIPLRRTLPWALARAVELVRRIDKTALVVGDCPGFLVNRILLPYLVESAWMLEEGTPVQRIDGALERFGMPMGPLALVDEVGIDVGYKVASVLEGAYGPRMHVPAALGVVAGSPGLLGRKSRRGFYLYRNGHRTPNPDVVRLLAEATHNGHPALSEPEIVDRAVLIMVNEAARCLEEGVVEGAEALDIAMIMGTGFAPFRGGLLRYADERGIGDVHRRLDELSQIHGERFRPAPLIERLARSGGTFHDPGGKW
jgi:3-hydroxyacyl-CoA dehydrogenase/enoyl-CoA hydratase/3-hydroxybutyryl-CoA epimerase